MSAIDEGRRALQRGAWSKARTLFERELKRAESPEALEGLGWSLHWLDDIEASLAHRERAYRAYLDRGARVDAARVALGLAVGSFDVRGAAVTSGWLERAKHLLRGTPRSVAHGWLALYEGHLERIVNDDPAAARNLARKAARLARQFGETQLELLAGALEGLALISGGRVADGMRRVDEATTAAMAGEMRDLDAVAQTCCILLYACERVRDYKRAAEWQQRIRRFCDEWEIQPLFAVCATQEAAMLIGSGAWREAEAKLDAALERLEKTRPLLVPDAIVQLAELRRRQGRTEEALALFRRAENRTESLLGRAAIALEAGDATTAHEFAERLLARPLGEKWIERALALEIVGRVDELSDVATRVNTPTLHAIERRAAGTAAFANRDYDTARNALIASITLFEQSNAPFEAATARLTLGRVLLALNRTSAANEEIDAATKILRTLGVTVPKASADQNVLTAREREVLHLIAGGLADKELAVRLSVSEHTVHRHVSNILRKLGAPSRTAAVAQALRNGWM